MSLYIFLDLLHFYTNDLKERNFDLIRLIFNYKFSNLMT